MLPAVPVDTIQLSPTVTIENEKIQIVCSCKSRFRFKVEKMINNSWYIFLLKNIDHFLSILNEQCSILVNSFEIHLFTFLP